MGTAIASTSLSLDDVPVNSTCSVENVEGLNGQAARLAGLGIGVGRQVRIVKKGEPTIVQVYETRIGLARSLASGVQVSMTEASE